MLHLKTPNALNRFFIYIYTHRLYQALNVLLYGKTYEMLCNSVKQCDLEPSMKGFLSINPNNAYSMIRQLILNYALAIFISKKEIVVTMFKFKMLVVISFLKFLTVSIILEYRDLLEQVIIPKEVKELRVKA